MMMRYYINWESVNNNLEAKNILQISNERGEVWLPVGLRSYVQFLLPLSNNLIDQRVSLYSIAVSLIRYE